MVGVVVATHGRLGEELLRTAEGVVGPLAQVRAVAVVASEPDVRARIEAAIREADTGEGVLLLTDLLGGSATNLCVSFLAEREVEIITGVNLPMLLKLGSARAGKKPLGEIAHELIAAAQKSIMQPSELLRGRHG